MTLIEIVRSGNLEALRATLAKFPEETRETLRREELLHYASRLGALPLVREILLAGVPSDLRDKAKAWTPAFHALESGRLAVLRLLIENRPKALDDTDSDGRTLLHRAAENLFPSAVALLLEAGADPDANAVLSEDRPLHAAVLGGCPECVRRLLEAGADPNLPAESGETPLYLAAMRNPHLIAPLLAAGAAIPARPETDHVVSYAPTAPEHLRHGFFRLLRAGGDIHDYLGDTPGLSAIHMATRDDPMDTARLLALGADIDAPAGMTGRTPLHLTTDNCSRPTATILLQLGADIDRRTRENRTALWLAASKADTPMFHLLQQAGANAGSLLEEIGTKDSWEKTALKNQDPMSPGRRVLHAFGNPKSFRSILTLVRWTPAQWETWCSRTRHLEEFGAAALDNPTLPESLRPYLLTALS